MISFVSDNGHQKDMCCKEIEFMCSIMPKAPFDIQICNWVVGSAPIY